MDDEEFFQCPECHADLDEAALKLQVAHTMVEQGQLSGEVKVTTTCPECGAELVAEEVVLLRVDFAGVFAPA